MEKYSDIIHKKNLRVLELLLPVPWGKTSIENILVMGEPCESGGLGGLFRVGGTLCLSPVAVPSDPPWIFRFGIM